MEEKERPVPSRMTRLAIIIVYAEYYRNRKQENRQIKTEKW